MSNMLRILVTEATSATAYHLLPMLASGDVIQGWQLELMLCDCKEADENMRGVAMELQDCAFPLLSSVTLTNNFCEASKTADVIIMLPSQNMDTGRLGNKEVEVSYSSLHQVDFSSLDTVMHKSTVSKTRSATVSCNGPLSTACAIAESVKQIHEESVKAIEREIQTRHEEAEFGCPPDASLEDILLTRCDYHFGPMIVGTKTLVIFVSSRNINDSEIADGDSIEDTVIFTRVYARL